MSRKLLLLTILAVFIGLASFAQSAGDQDCITAIPVCQPYYQQTNSYVGTGSQYPNELSSINQGCLGSGERNDAWYIINVTTTGVLEFTITPVNLSDDYDFAVWDITGVGCSAIYNYSTNTPNPYPPVACNYSGTPGQTGLSNTITGSQWSLGLPVTAGQTFALNVSNFSSTASGYSLNFVNNTSGISIYDTVPPKVTDVITHCQFPSDTLTIKISEPVKCSSISPTGSEWTITPAAGGAVPVSAYGVNCGAFTNSASSTIQLALAAPLPPGNYTLDIGPGTDNNTLLDNCGNEARQLSFPFTIVSPDPPAIVAADTPACIKVRIYLNRPVKCASIAADGSDFAISGPSPVTIVRAAPAGCNSYGIGDTIDVFFARSIYTPGIYTLSFQTGTDGDGVTDTCGVAAAGTFPFPVSDQGYLEALATPALLCAPGYTGLSSAFYIPPPPMDLPCGTNGSVCTGTPADYAAGKTNATGSVVNTPLYASNTDARTQMIFRASELNTAGMRSGTITQIALNVTARNSSFAYSNFTVKIGCTSQSSLTDFVPGLPIVYSPQSFNPVVGPNVIPLNSTYDWDGESNLIVEICYHNLTTGTANDAVLTSTGLYPGAVYHNHLNNGGVNGCALGSSNGSPVASNARPNITFTQCKPPVGNHRFLWTPSAYLQDSTAQNTLAYVPKTTTYQVQIKDSFYCYRRATATVTVSVRNPSISRDTFVCYGQGIGIAAAGGVSYQWFPTAGLSCSDCSNPTAAPAQTTQYFASITDSYGCSDTLSTTVTVHPLPPVRINTHDTAIVYGRGGQLFVRTGGSVKQYYWNPSSGLSDPLSANPIANPKLTTEYVVIVKDTNNCLASDTVLVRVRTDVPVIIPTAFTPDGDGRNDFFGVFNMTFQRLTEFRVFNRWGQEIFSTQDSHTMWDGTYNGVKQPQGTYQYLIRVAWPDGRVEKYQGDVTLVR